MHVVEVTARVDRITRAIEHIELELRSDRERTSDIADAVDVSTFDLSPERPMGGMGSAQTNKQIWMLIAIVTAICVALAAIIVVLAVLL